MSNLAIKKVHLTDVPYFVYKNRLWSEAIKGSYAEQSSAIVVPSGQRNDSIKFITLITYPSSIEFSLLQTQLCDELCSAAVVQRTATAVSLRIVTDCNGHKSRVLTTSVELLLQLFDVSGRAKLLFDKHPIVRTLAKAMLRATAGSILRGDQIDRLQ